MNDIGTILGWIFGGLLFGLIILSVIWSIRGSGILSRWYNKVLIGVAGLACLGLIIWGTTA